jgi:methyl-accepting chemotaxis protein
MLAVGVLFSTQKSISTGQKRNLTNIRALRMKGYDESVRYQVQNVISLLDAIYSRQQAGELTEEEAKTEAKALVKSLRYGDDGTGYFWIDNTDFTLEAHPILPQNEGKNRRDLKDQNGVMIIQEIMKVVEKNEAGGFSEFYFTKADGVTVKPKRTYSILFKPWHWVVSSGNYYDDINAEIDTISSQMKMQFKMMYESSFIVILLLLTASIIIAIIFSKKFSEPITETATVLQDMEGGNLTLRLPPIKQKNEIGRMRRMVNSFAETMNLMIATTRQNISSLNQVASELDTSSNTISQEIKQISENSVGLSRHAKVQKKTVNDTVTTMNTMIELIADLSKRIDEQNEAVSQSSVAVEQMIANIKSITQNVDKFGTSFNNLSTDSESGNKIINEVIELMQTVSVESEKLLDTNKVIEDVATQTNLLSMNAAIEAAHAGTAGRGFAVVADEIRKLSESTTKQSNNIRETLTRVIERIQTVSEASKNAGKVFSGIVEKISADNAIVTEIKGAMEEQSAGSQQMVSALGNIKNTTQTIISSSATMNTGVSAAGKQVAELERLADGLERGTAEIELSTQKISESSKKLTIMAADNRTFASTLSMTTERFKV